MHWLKISTPKLLKSAKLAHTPLIIQPKNFQLSPFQSDFTQHLPIAGQMSHLNTYVRMRSISSARVACLIGNQT